MKIEEDFLEDFLGDDIDSYIIESDMSGKRLDVFLAEIYNDFSRSQIQKMIKEENILVNSKVEKSSYKLCEDDEIILKRPSKEVTEILPQDLNLDIIYEDEHLLVVNKPKNMVVHPAPGNYEGTLVNGLKFLYGDNLSDINGDFRPGIVHRIDKDTSGILVVAKDNTTHEGLSKQFFDHSITREYEMICVGNVDWSECTVNENIGRNPKNRMKMAVVKDGGKRAVTHFHLIDQFEGFSYIKATLETGRTHQIRVHSAFLKHPILGDVVYGFKIKKFSNLQGQTLHARKLGFVHPITGEYMEFSTGLPDYFYKLLNVLELHTV